MANEQSFLIVGPSPTYHLTPSVTVYLIGVHISTDRSRNSNNYVPKCDAQYRIA